MSNPQLPMDIPQTDNIGLQPDNREDWAKGREIDEYGVSQTHKGYGRRETPMAGVVPPEGSFRYIEQG